MPEQIQRHKECLSTRQTIQKNVDWINNVDVFLDEGDEGYEEQYDNLNFALAAVHHAFRDRPQICMMRVDGDEIYSCDNCAFNAEIGL